MRKYFIEIALREVTVSATQTVAVPRFNVGDVAVYAHSPHFNQFTCEAIVGEVRQRLSPRQPIKTIWLLPTFGNCAACGAEMFRIDINESPNPKNPLVCERCGTFS